MTGKTLAKNMAGRRLSLIYVTFDIEGIHAWKDAPEEVAFLRNDHRHLFKYKVHIEVKHNDRDIEFFLFQREMLEACATHPPYGSCEMRAEQLLEYLQNNYPGRNVSVEVSEDGENGAIVYFWSERKEMRYAS